MIRSAAGLHARVRHARGLTVALVTLMSTLTGAGAGVTGSQPRATPSAPPQTGPAVYRPELKIPETIEPFLEHLEPGGDAFPEEAHAQEIERELRALADALRAGGGRAAAAAARHLASDFRGARLQPADSGARGDAPFEVMRAETLPQEPTLDAGAFGAELRRLVDDLREVTVVELLITGLEEARPSAKLAVTTDVRYDIVGAGTNAWRVERVGSWRLTWRKADSGWRIVRWVATSHVQSRAKAPMFTEVTEAVLGGNESFRRQLSIALDDWSAALDSVLTRDSNGHHGISVGDADGDGLEDLYVAQPAGLPNRLYRARGDATFEDVTERAGLGVLDDTAQSLFADVDNDGDQDLVVATSTQPLLFENDGRGRFANVPGAFAFRQPLKGVLTSIAMADYDRDGFLDLYLCVYSYFFGAGEDKAGTPAPYYDARNGPPGVLFRNDGRGRFVEATEEAGLGEGNDRYHFAAAWADYDADGWIDLLVANDFGTKNLYRNLGRRGGAAVAFEDVAARAGVLDHGAGMSAAFLDYDNDGLLDIYTGNMWSDNGQRVTAYPRFMPDAPADVRALYRRHARGNSLLRNRGDGRFEDVTVTARAAMGRWAWASDALDFDSDGWQDLYVANGMLTREAPAARAGADARARDLDSFFWRQVVARSPLTRAKGTPYDEAWRAINQLLIHGSIASHQRNVLLRNDGRGGFDEVSGAAGLDLDQDGRAFATLDIDHDGDLDLAVMAARQAPQLRVFRNDVPRGAESSLAIRLVGSKSNRDAVGARVTLETDPIAPSTPSGASSAGTAPPSRQTRTVHAGSGFLSQHSRELMFGLGSGARARRLTVDWPSGERQVFTDVPPAGRLRLVEGGALEHQPFAARTTPDDGARRAAGDRAARSASAGVETWLYEPFPAPDFSARDVAGRTWSLSSLRGRPAVLLFWSTNVPESRAALAAIAVGARVLRPAGIAALGIAVDAPAGLAGDSAVDASVDAVPVIAATRELALSYAIVNRHLFMNRQDLRLPTILLVDGAGAIVKVYRGRVDVPRIVEDAGAIDVAPAARLTRALPFSGTFYGPLAVRNYLPYGRELLDQGLDQAAVAAFERAAQASPSASTLYRLGTLLARTGETARARAAFERALALQPDLAEANNDLGALLAQGGDIDGAIGRFKAAIASMPEYPDALNNLGFALLSTGREDDARALYEKALALQPDFPEALNNLGLIFGRRGELERAEQYFRDALKRRAGYGEAANNLALVLVARGQQADAIRLLEEFIAAHPRFEETYVTLAKIHLSANRVREGLAVLERLLQLNATHAVALELVRQFKGR